MWVSEEPKGIMKIFELKFLALTSRLCFQETVTRLLTRHMRLDLAHFSNPVEVSPSWHRNTCIVLGSLAEKLAGPSSVQICTNTTLNYLLDNLVSFNK